MPVGGGFDRVAIHEHFAPQSFIASYCDRRTEPLPSPLVAGFLAAPLPLRRSVVTGGIARGGAR